MLKRIEDLFDATGVFEAGEFHHRQCNGLEAEGALHLFGVWLVNNNFEYDYQDGIDNLSGERPDGWTCMDWYSKEDYETGEVYQVAGCFIDGTCVFVEIWKDDKHVADIRLN